MVDEWYPLGRYIQLTGVTGLAFVAPYREEREVDYAVEMLREQRESASMEAASVIVAAVKSLEIAKMAVGTRVSFAKKFNGDKEYTYLAFKSDVGWFVTKKNRAYTDEALEELLASGLGFANFAYLEEVVTE